MSETATVITEYVQEIVSNEVDFIKISPAKKKISSKNFLKKTEDDELDTTEDDSDFFEEWK